MNVVEVVENPRKRRKRRSYTAKQRAAGFGGKRRRSSPRQRPRRRPRRNPGLSVLANPRRRRRSRGYTVRHTVRRRRNPALGGLFGTVDLQAVLFVTGGALGVKILPGIVRRWFPMLPAYGLGGMAVRAGTVLLLGMGAKMLTGSKQRATQVVTGGLAVLALETWDLYGAPMLGLSGSEYASGREIQDVLGMNGFTSTPRGLGAFTPTPRGLGAYVDSPDEVLAA